MDRKEIMKSCLEGAYPCLECESVNDVDIVSFGKEEEPFILNFQVTGDGIDVNIIDRNRKKVIDHYAESFENEEEFKHKIDEAAVAYNVILSAKPHVEEKLESDDKKARIDECIFQINEILNDCKNISDTYGKQDDIDEEEFDKVLVTAVNSIELHLADLKKEMHEPLNENTDEKPADRPETKETDDDSKDIVTQDEIADAMEAASVHDLLQTVIDKLNDRAESEEDELTERVVSDIAVQAEEMLDELDSMIQ